jgi:hypothetical protein
MECKSCLINKPLAEFYANDSSCKDCRKSKVSANRLANIDYYRAYDRARGNRQDKGYLKQYRADNPSKYKAHNTVNNAIRDGNLFSQPCETCDDVQSVAHHDDYAKPLNVRWMCQAHHKQWHRDNGEGLNAH